MSKIVKTAQEICVLVEAGFEFITDFQDAKIFKKGSLTSSKKPKRIASFHPLTLLINGAGGGI
jgi:hypothetical protein